MNLRNFVILIITFLTAELAFSQASASLDKKFYWTYDKSYATLEVQSPTPGLNLTVILWDKDNQKEKVLIQETLETSHPKFFRIELMNLHTGNYSVEVHFGKEYSIPLDMVVLHSARR